ncbi:MAG: iron-sulfur cluster assembly scaffold protein [Promethearchaeota archaeon]
MPYNEKVMDYFLNPKNVGPIVNGGADAIGKIKSSDCEDLFKIYLKVKRMKNKDIISDIKFQTYGCAAAIASTSMVTVLAKGKTLEEAEKITKEDVAKALGGLPSEQMHCSNFGVDALREAIKNYRKAH